MFGLLMLGLFLFCGLLIVGMVGAVLKLVFWLVFLPIRIAMKLIALPFLAIGVFLKVIVGVLLLPVLAIGGVIGILGLGMVALMAVLLPLLPVALAGLAVWGLVRLLARPAVVAPRA